MDYDPERRRARERTVGRDQGGVASLRGRDVERVISRDVSTKRPRVLEQWPMGNPFDAPIPEVGNGLCGPRRPQATAED